MTTPESEAADQAWLTSPEHADLLRHALAPEGITLVSSEVHEVHHRPGAGVTVGYDVRVAAPDRPGDAPEVQYLLATTADLTRRGHEVTSPIVRLDDGSRVVHVWRHPYDPLLPGLAAATDPRAASERVARALNLTPDDDAPQLDLIVYRPLRRAVLSLTIGPTTVFLKVVRADQVEGLLERNRCAEPAGAPAVLDVWPESVLVFAQAQGEPLPNLLARDGARGLDPLDFIRRLDALDPAGAGLAKRESWAWRSALYEGAALNVLPDQAERIAALGCGVRDALALIPPAPQVTTHGDFHAGNIFMTDTEISGLLDVDTLGPGQRVEDLACLLGHLAVLPSLAPGTYLEVPQTLARWQAVLEEHCDPLALRVHTAGVLLSLIASMPRAREGAGDERTDALARLDAAERFLASASLDTSTHPQR